jgi:DNA-binding CsgD family transcriptional regulator
MNEQLVPTKGLLRAGYGQMQARLVHWARESFRCGLSYADGADGELAITLSPCVFFGRGRRRIGFLECSEKGMHFASRFAEITPKVGKYLWKLLFAGHSQNSSQSGIVDAMTFGNIPAVRHARVQSANLRSRQGSLMEEQTVRLGPRERQIVELLLQGCDNAEIASQLHMARRTVKAHFNRLFLRFGITGGIKRVKLATLLYRRQSCLQMSVMDPVSRTSVNSESSNLWPKA